MKRLIKYGNKRFGLLNTHLEKYKQNTNAEELHRVRIELKKIEILLDFLAFYSKKIDIVATYKPLRNIFREAGRIRETDVLHQLVEDYKLKRFEKDIIPDKAKTGHSIIRFKRKTGQFEKAVSRSYQKIKKYFAKVHKKDLKKCILKTEHKLNKELFGKFGLDELHKMRKQVKKIIFLSEILSNKSIPQKIKRYGKLQYIIGQWHDKNVLIDLLKQNKCSSYEAAVRKLKLGCTKDIKSIKPLLVALNTNK